MGGWQRDCENQTDSKKRNGIASERAYGCLEAIEMEDAWSISMRCIYKWHLYTPYISIIVLYMIWWGGCVCVCVDIAPNFTLFLMVHLI